MNYILTLLVAFELSFFKTLVKLSKAFNNSLTSLLEIFFSIFPFLFSTLFLVKLLQDLIKLI